MRGGGRDAGPRSARWHAGGGLRTLGLPFGGDDPTDGYDALTALVGGRPVSLLDHVAIAVVDKALRDFRMYARSTHERRRLWFENARAFLFDRDVDPGWPLTFAAVCERFDVDVDAARAAIQTRCGSLRRVRLRSHGPTQPRVVSRETPWPPVRTPWHQHVLPVWLGRFKIAPIRPRRRRRWLAHGVDVCRHCLCEARTGTLALRPRRRRPAALEAARVVEPERLRARAAAAGARVVGLPRAAASVVGRVGQPRVVAVSPLVVA